MKCLAGMAAVFVVSAALSQTPNSTPAADVVLATRYVRMAAGDFTQCKYVSDCNAYFETFGVALSFGDGTLAPFSHVQRLAATPYDCIKKAKALEQQGDRALAVQWVMAARLENVKLRSWLGSHPDAVLAALQRVTL